MKDVSLENAHTAVMAALAKSEEMGVKMNIAIVDAGANLTAFVRMDGAWLGSVDIAVRKARTARMFDMNTGEIGKLSQPGGALFNIEHSNGGLITFPGGIPLRDGSDTVIGAIGVSGSTVEDALVEQQFAAQSHQDAAHRRVKWLVVVEQLFCAGDALERGLRRAAQTIDACELCDCPRTRHGTQVGQRSVQRALGLAHASGRG